MMNLNESQRLIIGTIVSARLGLPNIQKVFTEEIIQIVSQDSSIFLIILVSILKIALVLFSISWLTKLVKNIQFTYEKHYNTFEDYILKLILTGMVTFIIILIIQKII